MNPLRYLRPAVYAALTSPAVVLNGAVVPVRAYGSGAEPVYILLNPDQDTQNLTTTARACEQWDCTLLVDVVTLHQNGELSVALADETADAVTAHLHRNRLALPAGLQVMRAVVETMNGGSGLDGEQVDIHRYLRVRYSIAYTPAAASLQAPQITNVVFTGDAVLLTPQITNAVFAAA